MVVLVDFLSIVKKYAPNFESCFSPAGYEYFKKAVSGFLVSDNKTLEAINRLFILSPRNQSSFNKFFNRQNFDLDQINKVRLDLLSQYTGTKFKKVEGRSGVLSVDNTLLKHYGKKFDHICNLKDYVNDCYRMAHDLVTLHYSDDLTDYPVFYRLWEPADWDAIAYFLKYNGASINSEKWTARKRQVRVWNRYMGQRYKDCRKKYPQLKQLYKTKLHIAEDLIRKFCKTFPAYDFPIALDSGFTSAELCYIIAKDLKRNYVGSLNLEQCIYTKGNQTIKLNNIS